MATEKDVGATDGKSVFIGSVPYDNTDYKKKMNKRARDRGLNTVPFPEIEVENPLTNQIMDSIVQEAISDICSLLDVAPKLANGMISRSLERIYFKSAGTAT